MVQFAQVAVFPKKHSTTLSSCAKQFSLGNPSTSREYAGMNKRADIAVSAIVNILDNKVLFINSSTFSLLAVADVSSR
jgi:hypothetical protein